MIRVHRVESFELPGLAPYLTMRGQHAHREQGIFVAESDKVVRRLLESPLTIISLLLPEKWLQAFEPLLAQRTDDIDVYIMEKARLETLTGFTFYQGVLGLAKVPTAPSLEALLSSSPTPKLLVGVEGVTSAENMGSLVRNCVAFGVQGLLVDRSSCSPFLRRAVRSSMGTIFRVPVIEQLELAAKALTLKAAGLHCIAAHPHTDEVLLPKADLRQSCCVIFGSEGYGISPGLLQRCDQAVAVRMASGVDSLNVGSAGAVFLYEVSRQRGAQD